MVEPLGQYAPTAMPEGWNGQDIGLVVADEETMNNALVHESNWEYLYVQSMFAVACLTHKVSAYADDTKTVVPLMPFIVGQGTSEYLSTDQRGKYIEAFRYVKHLADQNCDNKEIVAVGLWLCDAHYGIIEFNARNNKLSMRHSRKHDIDADSAEHRAYDEKVYKSYQAVIQSVFDDLPLRDDETTSVGSPGGDDPSVCAPAAINEIHRVLFGKYIDGCVVKIGRFPVFLPDNREKMSRWYIRSLRDLMAKNVVAEPPTEGRA